MAVAKLWTISVMRRWSPSMWKCCGASLLIPSWRQPRVRLHGTRGSVRPCLKKHRKRSSPKADPWDKRTHASHPHDLPRLFSGNAARLLIGHNVGYDRARIAEEYGLEATTTRFIDTLSLHVATRGITSVQRPAWLQHRKNKAEKTLRESETINFLQEEAERDGNGSLFEALQSITPSSDAEAAALQKRWEDVTAVNSLAEVANLHCGHTIDKSIRDRFGDESITHASQLRGELQDLLSYCARDTFTTHEVYKKVFPLYRQNCPHPASFAGMLKMGSSFLPVNESWAAYLKQAEMKYRELDDGVKDALNTLAEKLRRETPQENDPWTRQLDWTPKAARWPDQHTDSAMGGPQFRESEQATEHKPSKSPRWYQQLATDSGEILSNHTQRYLLPLLLKMRFKGHPVAYLTKEYWCFMAPHESICDYVDNHGEPVELDAKDVLIQQLAEKFAFFRIGSPNAARLTKLMGPKLKKMVTANEIDIADDGLLTSLVASAQSDISDRLSLLADETKSAGPIDEWSRQLDWSDAQTPKPGAAAKEAHGTWPKWYHDLTSPVSEEHPLGELDLTVKKTVAPLLLRLQWQGFPLTYSREHKWLYRVPREFVSAEASQESKARGRPVSFFKSEDQPFALDEDHVYFRLPHKDGEGNNVGNPLSKSFVKSIENGELASAAAATGDVVAAQAAYNATNMNVLCSYWISSRERIMDQMVVYEDDSKGMILPQVIPMGTVTRRAVEATWLTASNAKKNRVGSELKAMVRAPPGYSIVGADVDSEELWISSVMGDSQFRMHGATAIGWMTLEGTKSAGTDLHSKTAGILGISRDAAKIFNYSRIYGAGQKHSIQLLMQNDSTLSKEKAMQLARDLYKATKGARTFRDKTALPAAIPSMWHGGSESYLFNTLEAIAFSERPITPALGCGITRALRKAYLDESAAYLPSRVNWVVQSSGVDYLHLLIVAMEYLIRTYGISARYMISVHDEVRYLAKEEDRYRTALALQIANAWTRALFCYNLGIDDVPQGVAFFSAVDIDHVLRKEVSMTCETPSHPSPIPPGEALDMFAVLDKTGGSLGSPVTRETPTAFEHKSGADTDADAPDDKAGKDLTSIRHRQYLHAQAQVMGVEAKKWLNAQAAVINPEADLLSSHRPVKSPGRRAGIAS